jgi:hypothetical protein
MTPRSLRWFFVGVGASSILVVIFLLLSPVLST